MFHKNNRTGKQKQHHQGLGWAGGSEWQGGMTDIWAGKLASGACTLASRMVVQTMTGCNQRCFIKMNNVINDDVCGFEQSYFHIKGNCNHLFQFKSRTYSPDRVWHSQWSHWTLNDWLGRFRHQALVFRNTLFILMENLWVDGSEPENTKSKSSTSTLSCLVVSLSCRKPHL